MKDYLDVENAKGLPALADANIALDFLLSAKNGVRNYAIALTEVVTPQIKATLHAQLETTIALHEAIANLMTKKGWLHPYDIIEQFQLDMTSAQTAVQIAGMPLFPEETNRLGTFATPHK